MLKTAASLKKSIFDKLKDDNGEGGDSISSDGIKLARKSEKSKGQKLAKSQKSKSEKSKKQSKSGNSPHFDAMKFRSSILTFDAKIAFNRLWLVFTEALIF